MSAITNFGRSMVSTLKEGISDLAAVARDVRAVAREIAKDINTIFQRTNNDVPRLKSNSGASTASTGSAAKDLADLKLSGYQLLKGKVKGVEAGFVSQKQWNAKDHEKPLLESGQPFNIRAKEWLSEQLTGTMYRKSAEKLFTLGVEKLRQDTESIAKLGENSRIQLDEIDTKGPQHGSFDSFTPELKNAAFQEALASLPKKEFSKLYQGIKNTILAEKHAFKEEYHTRLPDIKPGSLLAQYVIHKAKSTGTSTDFLDMVHKLDNISRQATRLEASHQVVVNDFTEKLGIKTHKLEAKFIGDMHTGTALLHSSQPLSFTEFNGREGPNEGRVYLKDGVLVQNTPDGNPKLYKDIDGLGRDMIKLAVLGIRDPISNNGLATIEGKTHFYSNETKHMLRKDLQSKPVGVNSDFSLKTTSQHKLMDPKNFSIFDQSTYAEKMEGVRQIKNEAGTSLTPALRELYKGRRDEILKTFENRLAVDNFSFEGIKSTEEKKAAIDQTLNLLDGLEKLTSKTVGTANGTKDGIRLDIPRVQETKDRKAWNVQQSGNQIQFTFEGTSAQAGDILKTLQDYSVKGHARSEAYHFRQGPDNFITVTVNSADIAHAQAALSYGNIMDYKHPRTTS